MSYDVRNNAISRYVESHFKHFPETEFTRESVAADAVHMYDRIIEERRMFPGLQSKVDELEKREAEIRKQLRDARKELNLYRIRVMNCCSHLKLCQHCMLEDQVYRPVGCPMDYGEFSCSDACRDIPGYHWDYCLEHAPLHVSRYGR